MARAPKAAPAGLEVVLCEFTMITHFTSKSHSCIIRWSERTFPMDPDLSCFFFSSKCLHHSCIACWFERQGFYLLSAIAMDGLAAMFHAQAYRKVDPTIDIQFRTEINGATLGFATSNGDLYSFLESFLDANEESLEVIRSNALFKQVTFCLETIFF